MASPARIGVAVLAAGASQRFGAGDKLMADFRGSPLGEHVVQAVPSELFAHRWVIASDPDHPCAPAWSAAGFEVVHNTLASRGMGTSAACAANQALRHGCDALLIALADMPLVPSAHFAALVQHLAGDDDIVASGKGAVRLPPAIFGRNHLDRLAQARGDEGARRWLAAGRTVACPHDWLIDIDRPEDLEEYRQAGDRAPTGGAEGEEL